MPGKKDCREIGRMGITHTTQVGRQVDTLKIILCRNFQTLIFAEKSSLNLLDERNTAAWVKKLTKVALVTHTHTKKSFEK